MYQLSHLLSEGRSLIASLSPISESRNILSSEPYSLPTKEADDNDGTSEIKRKRALSDISEKVEGCIVSKNCFR